jgi:hypothetical protein
LQAGLPATVGRLAAARVAKSLRGTGTSTTEETLNGGDIEAAATRAPEALSNRRLASVTHSAGHGVGVVAVGNGRVVLATRPVGRLGILAAGGRGQGVGSTSGVLDAGSHRPPIAD